MKEKMVIGYQLENEFNNKFKYGARVVCAKWLGLSRSYFGKQLKEEKRIMTSLFFNICQLIDIHPSEIWSISNQKERKQSQIDKIELKNFPKKITNKDIGRVLANSRKENNKTLSQIAFAMDISGIENASMDYVNLRELGKTTIRLEETLVFCDIYGISIDDLYEETLKLS